MMLVQKQPLFSMSLAQSPQQYNVHHHRRHPSAPAHPIVQVQPTRTPGLLSLSKPPRASKGSPRPKPAQQAQRSPKPAPAQQAQQVVETRGRQHPQQGNNNHNNKQRSASHAAPNRRRQPSPDPFAPAATTATPSPAAPPPNKRRSHQPGGTTTAPIPVPPPMPNPAHGLNNVSRSDPVLSHMPKRRKPPQRTTTLDSASFSLSHSANSSFGEFPICDDTDTVDSRPSTPTPSSPTTGRRSKPAMLMHLSEPRTPTRKSRQQEPPKTAPLSSVNPGSFPFPVHGGTNGNSHLGASPAASGQGQSPSPHSSPKRKADRRAKHLSEGVVLPPLFPFMFPRGEQGFAEKHGEIEVQRRSRSSERHGSEPPPSHAQQTLFASSMFQNSPSPEELPPPSFL